MEVFMEMSSEKRDADYTVLVKQKNGKYICYIKELAITASGSSLEEAYSKVTANKEELIKIWNRLEENQRGYYKPTETTKKQLELIYDLSKLLNRKDASKLIHLLYILTNKENEEEALDSY